MSRKALNKKMLVAASSIIVATSLAIAVIIYSRKRHKQNRMMSVPPVPVTRTTKDETALPRQTRVTAATDAAYSMQQPSEQQQPVLLQESQMQKSQTTATTTAAVPVTYDTAANDAAIAAASTAEPAMPSPATTYTATTTLVVKDEEKEKYVSHEEASVSEKAWQAGESLKELVAAAIKRAKDSTKEKAGQLKDYTVNLAVTVDSNDIRSLKKDDVKTMVELFEDMVAEIRKEAYDEQIILLDNYKRLLQEQIRLVEARRRMASKLKPGA